MADKNFTFRVDGDLKDSFLVTAEANAQNASLLLRGFMRDYINQHAKQGAPVNASEKRRPKARRLSTAARA